MVGIPPREASDRLVIFQVMISNLLVFYYYSISDQLL